MQIISVTAWDSSLYNYKRGTTFESCRQSVKQSLPAEMQSLKAQMFRRHSNFFFLRIN